MTRGKHDYGMWSDSRKDRAIKQMKELLLVNELLGRPERKGKIYARPHGVRGTGFKVPRAHKLVWSGSSKDKYSPRAVAKVKDIIKQIQSDR
jgi:hypothetical protein